MWTLKGRKHFGSEWDNHWKDESGDTNAIEEQRARNGIVQIHNFHPLSIYLKAKMTLKNAICSLRIRTNIMQQLGWCKRWDQLNQR